MHERLYLVFSVTVPLFLSCHYCLRYGYGGPHGSMELSDPQGVGS